MATTCRGRWWYMHVRELPPLQLSVDVERSELVEPTPLPRGYMHPGPYGFTPEGVVTGGWMFVEDV